VADGDGKDRKSLDHGRFTALVGVIYYVSFAAHFTFIFVFWLVDKPTLGAFNVASVAIIASAIFAHRRGRVALGFALYTFEIVAHAAVATYVLGWQSGLFVYVSIPLMVVFFLPDTRPGAKLALSALLLALMIGIIAMSFVMPATNPYPSPLQEFSFVGNFVFMAAVNGAFALVFAQAVQAAEDGLQAANARLQHFAGAVSELLDPMLVGKLRTGADLSSDVRYLTVLFADLAGSTKLSQEMDDGAFGRMIDRFAAEMHAIIKRHGGFVEDISGDGILAYVGNFESGGPEEDAGAVVRMAVEMQQTLRDLNVGFAAEYDLPSPLQMRIGISSGEAFVGKSSGVRAIYTANGESVNLGAKLEQALKTLEPPDGILISQTTAGLIGADETDLTEHTLQIGGRSHAAFSVDC